MMKFFASITGFLRFFSLYADPFEKEADRFLRKLGKHARRDLIGLMQKDLVKLTIFFEYRFKAYKKFRKSARKKLYQNALLVKGDFQKYFGTQKNSIVRHQTTMDLPAGLKKDERLTYLLGIMSYLKPGVRLRYEASATFAKLLRDPRSEVLAGDCNQIVTLYIYLYSLRYPVTDLQIKILPEHVCLHYRGLDIETTVARIAEYPVYTFLSGVEEIVAANLLDIPDPSEKQFSVSPANLLKSAQVAYHFSSHRPVVERNLLIAYHNMAVYYAKQKNFRKASEFANKSGNTKLQAQISRMRAAGELADLFESIRLLKKLSDFKSRRPTLRRIQELARLTGNQQAEQLVSQILNKLE